MLGNMALLASPGRRALRRGRFSQRYSVYLVTTVTDRAPLVPELSRQDCLSQHDASLLSARCQESLLGGDARPRALAAGVGRCGFERGLKRFKARTAVLLNREIGHEGRFWAPGFHDHALRREEDLLGVARYIVANPLRAGLVRRLGIRIGMQSGCKERALFAIVVIPNKFGPTQSRDKTLC
jgi:hypothetical protein